ncbi:hypothetical protein NK8_68200 (plasmid) [Caballeronia sp. NK8]|nr:hypothetical protein NK8_68200 [Caballeronia sp. NK8]
MHRRITAHHRTLLKLHLDVIDALQHTLAELDVTLGKALAPIRQCGRLLSTIPGVSDVTAQVSLAEVGADITRFPNAAHLISWAGLCPRNDESAGKRRSTRVRKSGTWLKTALVTAAWAGVRVKSTYLHAQFLRIKARRGPKKAMLAVAASMLTALAHALRRRCLCGPRHRLLQPARHQQNDTTDPQAACRSRLPSSGGCFTMNASYQSRGTPEAASW